MSCGIDRRTVRRYVATLQELGIPIEGERGVGGGYRVRPGYRLPPLMLGDDEAAAVVFGLVAAARLGLATDGVDGALAKIHRVLPDAVRGRVEALESTLGFTTAPSETPPVAGAAALLLADAIRRRRRIHVRYRTFAGDESRRELSPFGLVVHSGRWYLAAHDHGRDDLRTFRVDRIDDAELANEPAATRTGGIRSGRTRTSVAGASPVAVGSGGAARPAAGASVGAPADHAGRARAGGRGDAPPHARELARLDGRRPRRARLRLHDPAA